MKKFLSLILVALMLLASVAFAEPADLTGKELAQYVLENMVLLEPDADGVITFGDLTTDEDMEYDPNPEYDYFTVIFYVNEKAGNAEMIITCNAKEDFSEFCLEYSFYAADQKTIVDAEGNVSYDLSGFMRNDTPGMLQYILQNAAGWAKIEKAAE